MTEEKTLSTRMAFEGRHIRVRVDTVSTAGGGESTREIVEIGGAVVVIAIDTDDNILLVRQYRKAVEKELLEIPAGGIDPGEDAEAAVLREMQEETGFLPGKLERLGGFYSTPGFCTEYLHLYLATGLAPRQLNAEDTAGISLVRVPMKDIPELVTSGKIEDAKSIAGLYKFLEYRQERRPD